MAQETIKEIIEKLQIEIVDKQNFIDCNEDLISPIQKKIIEINLTKDKEKLKALKEHLSTFSN